MSLRITFELSDDDLQHFRREMKRASAAHKKIDDETVIKAAADLLAQVKPAKAPDFISTRLARLKVLIDMLHDEGFALPEAERSRVLSALAYFANPDDLIPDEIPGLGFLDDAIMIELVVRGLKHEIEAYEDFCKFRNAEATRHGKKSSELVRTDFMVERRKQLHSRIRRRRRSSRARRGGRISSLDIFGG